MYLPTYYFNSILLMTSSKRYCLLDDVYELNCWQKRFTI